MHPISRRGVGAPHPCSRVNKNEVDESSMGDVGGYDWLTMSSYTCRAHARLLAVGFWLQHIYVLNSVRVYTRLHTCILMHVMED